MTSSEALRSSTWNPAATLGRIDNRNIDAIEVIHGADLPQVKALNHEGEYSPGNDKADGTSSPPPYTDANMEKQDTYVDGKGPGDSHSIGVTDSLHEDYMHARSLLRTSTWISTFYLITTDILGPSNAGYSMSTLGYVPGALLYFFFGVGAMYAGFILLRLYLVYDSPQTPMRTYSDIGAAVFARYGPRVRFGVRAMLAFFQALQQLFSVAIIILGNASGLQQISYGPPDNPTNANYSFLYLTAGFMLAGMLLAQIRTFKALSQLANSCIWLNIFVAFMTVGLAAIDGPLRATTPINAPPGGLWQSFGQGLVSDDSGNAIQNADGSYTPDPTFTASYPWFYIGSPVHTDITSPYAWPIMMNGVMNMCYAYAGANMFVEFMAEMKDPREFWKSQVLAQSIIITVYMLYGLLVYSYQGQYVANPANQGISSYGWQTVGNTIGLFTALIAAVMYGNIGMKVTYVAIAEEIFKAPPLATRTGRIIWTFLGIAFWAVAWVLCESIPNFGDLVSVTSATCVLQYTYTFPALFQLVYEVGQDRTWGEVFRRRWYIKLIDLMLFLCSLSIMGLGMYSSINQMIEDSKTGGFKPFGDQYG